MSLVSTWVEMDDGRWHQNPVLGQGKRWFICYDDDDPIELVVQAQTYDQAHRRIEEAREALKPCALTVMRHKRGKYQGKTVLRKSGLRCFGPDNEFLPAFNVWIWITKPPVALLLKETASSAILPMGDKVYYCAEPETPEMFR